ncbi:hypothetical protein Vadar_000427 [Vaccinium darrowii]|uniref:Uncharacterized protein n=1 Tax=Vaccinium darrowii TaxID=229202 RepID=A0ACB7Z9N3_9ERIC|nr:hypothetical protein Vadar_000427 [Vaccinium darrowii]
MVVVGERMITRSAFKRTLEESSSDVNNNKQQQNQQPPKGKKQKKMKSLKKDDGKKKEYRLNVNNQQRLFLNHRPFTFQERMDYNRRIKQSGGFDVGDFPDNINSLDMPIRPYYVPDKLGGIDKLKMVENCSKLAMDKYNKDNETKYQFGKVLKANSRGCWSWNAAVLHNNNNSLVMGRLNSSRSMLVEILGLS